MKANNYYYTIHAVLLFFLIAQGSQLCRATLDCPINYANDTVTVPYNVVMLSEIFEHCSPDSIKEGIIDTTTDTISLFIIIDHSGSMSEVDPASNRYRFASNIIDSIYKMSPESEIGIAVFSNRLMHNKSTDPYFETLDNSEENSWNDAFIPLTKLNSQVSGVNAVEKLKWAIELDSTSSDPAGNYKLVNADYLTSGRKSYTGGTDISIAFEAAKEAFTSATYSNEKQFILFISDGKHQTIDTERNIYATDYINGENTPTTYTAYFINQGQAIPDQIKTMTTNIQNNGYSTNNFSSKVWSTESEEEEFLNNLFNNIIGDGLKKYTSTPQMLIINGDTTKEFDSLFAYYDMPFAPLNNDGSLELNISFTYKWDSPIDKDETKEYTLLVMQGEDEDLEAINCWEQGTIGIYSSGSEVYTAMPNQINLEVRFFPSKDSTAPPLGNNINIILQNMDQTDSLELKLNLDASQSYYHCSFIREYADPLEDGKLQNKNSDSLIATFRNPKIPLDTVRYGIPVMPLFDMTISRACYYDKDANGHPDIITASQKGGQVLTQDDCNLIKPFTVIHSPREIDAPTILTSESYGFSISIPQKVDTVTGKTDLYLSVSEQINELLSVKYQGTTPLSSGNELPFADLFIGDSMAPIINSAIYLDFEGATTADTLKVIFSEKTGPITGINPFHIINTNIPANQFTPDLKYVRTDNDTVVFIHTPQSGTPLISSNDSIWINSDGGVADLQGVYQSNNNNVKRKITYYKVLSLLSASYLDNSSISDGLIDEISIKTDKVADSATINSILDLILLNPERQFTIKGFNIHDNGFSIEVAQPITKRPSTSTDTLDRIIIEQIFTENQTAIFATNIIITDSLPPVIIDGSFTLGFKTENSQTISDTLLVQFSEKVTPPPYASEQPFNFLCNSGDSSYTMTLSFIKAFSDSKTFQFAVLDKTKPYPQENDSLKIEILASISDSFGIYQENINNRYAPLNTSSSDILLSVTVTDNPGMHTDTYVADGKTIEGIGIKVNILGSGWPSGMEMKGILTIFDAVGNIVKEINGDAMANHSGFWFHWDASNSNSRLVHSGSYIGIIRITNVSENSSNEEKIIIGIKEEVE